MSRIPRRVKRALLPRGKAPRDERSVTAAWTVELATDAHVQKDLNGIITSWDRAAERLFGYTADEAIGQSVRLIIPPDHLSEEDTVLATIRADQPITRFRTVRQRKDGTRLPMTLTIVPLHDTAGRVIGATKTAHPRSIWGPKPPKTWTRWTLIQRWLRRHPAESTDLWRSVARRLWVTRS
jgi:PAS domain S-box-containing protein